jgi:hypothetical protein
VVVSSCSTNGFLTLLDSVSVASGSQRAILTILDFPISLTAWHMIFSTVMTQILARTTTLLDGRKTVKMTGRVYIRAILPIGFFFSLSLICGNQAYLYLSVAFIQMLKVGQFPRTRATDLTNFRLQCRSLCSSHLGLSALLQST